VIVEIYFLQIGHEAEGGEVRRNIIGKLPSSGQFFYYFLAARNWPQAAAASKPLE
jgi:hypothetical protein